MPGSENLDIIIDVCLALILLTTSVFGFFILYRKWRELREAARENAREEELWK